MLKIFEKVQEQMAAADLGALMKKLDRTRPRPGQKPIGQLPEEILRLYAAYDERLTRFDKVAFAGLGQLFTQAAGDRGAEEMERGLSSLFDEGKTLQEEIMLLNRLFMSEMDLLFPNTDPKGLGPEGKIYICPEDHQH